MHAKSGSRQLVRLTALVLGVVALRIAAPTAVPTRLVPRPQQPGEPTARPAETLLIRDLKRGYLLSVDPEAGRIVQTAEVPPEPLLAPGDGTRLLVTETSKQDIQVIHVLDGTTLKTLATFPLGRFCVTTFDLFPTELPSDMTWSGTGRALDLDCEGRIVRLDLDNLTLARSEPIPVSGLLGAFGDREAVVPTVGGGTTVTIVGPRGLELTPVALPCSGDLGHRSASGDQRKLVIECSPRPERGRNAPQPETSIFFVDLDTPDAPRELRLGPQFLARRILDDGRFLYAFNAHPGGEALSPSIASELLIISVDDEQVVERVVLERGAPDIGDVARGSFLVATGDRIRLLTDGRAQIVATLTREFSCCIGATRDVHGNLYVGSGKRWAKVTDPTGPPAWVAEFAIEGRLFPTPDGTRGLLQRRDDIELIDLNTGTTVSRFTVTTGRARAARFWSDLGASFVVGAIGGGYVDRSVGSSLAMSPDGKAAWLVGSTGEIVSVAVADGALTRVAERAASLHMLPQGVAILVSSRRVALLAVASRALVQDVAFNDGPSDTPPHLALSADGTRLSIGCGTSVVTLDVPSGRIVSRIEGLGSIDALRFLR